MGCLRSIKVLSTPLGFWSAALHFYASKKVYVPFAGPFGFPIVPLVRKPSISFASNPSSLRISSLCSPRSGARFAGTLVRHDAVLAQLRILDNVARIPHHAVGYVGLVEDFTPVCHGLRTEDLVHYRRELGHICGQLGKIGKSRIFQKICSADTLS